MALSCLEQYRNTRRRRSSPSSEISRSALPPLCREESGVFTVLFQSKLVRVQEVAVWSNPTVSLVWVVLSQALLYSLCNWTASLLSTLSYLLLSLYVYLTWVYTVWPAVRVPPSPDEVTGNISYILYNILKIFSQGPRDLDPAPPGRSVCPGAPNIS